MLLKFFMKIRTSNIFHYISRSTWPLSSELRVKIYGCLLFEYFLCSQTPEMAQFTLWTFFFTRFDNSEFVKIESANSNSWNNVMSSSNVQSWNMVIIAVSLIYSELFIKTWPSFIFQDEWAQGQKLWLFTVWIFFALQWLNSHFELSSSHVLMIRNSWKSKVQIQKGS